MFHDVGLVEGHRRENDRFEVDGANAARDYLERRGLSAEAIRVVWDAIALHTTPGIPEHKEPEVALVTAGVELDVLGLGYHDITDTQREQVLSAFGNVKADVLERTLPGYKRPNFCEAILTSPFAQ
jgi:hypothetical protein